MQKFEIGETYIPPKLKEVYAWKKGDNDSFLVINPNGPNWFKTNKFGVFLIDICNGKLSIKEMTKLLQKGGANVHITSLIRFFSFLNRIKFFDEGNEGTTELLASVFLNITARCNLKCIYCYYNSNSLERPDRLEVDADVWINIVNQIHKINKKAIITVSGGEPFLSDNLFPTLNILHKLQMQTRIYSNGTKISNGNIKQLKQYNNIEYIQISLDSVVDEENIKSRTVSPVRVMETMHRLKREGLPIVVSCTVTGINANSIQSFIDYCIENKFKYRFVNFFPAPGRALKNILDYKFDERLFAKKIKDLNGLGNNNINLTKGYKRLTKRTVCGLGKILSISESAKVYPCNHLYMDEFIMGDATKESLESIMQKSGDIFIPVSVDSMLPCKKCELRYICGGSCRATAYHEKGKLNVSSSECVFLKEIIINTLWEQTLMGGEKVFSSNSGTFYEGTPLTQTVIR